MRKYDLNIIELLRPLIEDLHYKNVHFTMKCTHIINFVSLLLY